MRTGPPKIHSETQLRERGSLNLSGPRDLLAAAGVPAAFELDGAPASGTRVWEGRLSHAVPERLKDGEVVQVCDQEVVWGGCFQPHYGHFLTEGIGRLWPLLPGGELEGLPVVCIYPAAAPYAREWARAFGLRTITPPTGGVARFRKMFVPESAWMLNSWAAPEARDVHLHARRGLDVPTAPPQGVLWLSRSALRPKLRPCDEALLEWLLAEHVTTINPETKTFAEQVAVIEASDGVAGLVGSAFHTLLTTRNPPDSLLLCPDEVKSAYTVQDFLLGKNSTFVRALTVDERLGRRGAGSLGRHRVLIPEALRALASTLLPGLRDDPEVAALMSPERLLSTTGRDRSSDSPHVALARVVLDPRSAPLRIRLAAMFEERGLDECALEQFLIAADLSGTRDGPARIGAVRALVRLGRRKRTAGIAEQMLALMPGHLSHPGRLGGWRRPPMRGVDGDLG